MLKVWQTLIWTIERGIEVFLLAWLLLLVFGVTNMPNIVTSAQNVFRNAAFVSYAFVFSGYIVTTAWFGMFRRQANPVRHGFTMIVLYLLHCAIFLLAWDYSQLAPIIAFGSCVVAFSSLIGCLLLHLLSPWGKSSVPK